MIRRLLIAFLPFAPTTLAMGAAAKGKSRPTLPSSWPLPPSSANGNAISLPECPTSPSRWRNENESFPSFANVFTA